MMSELDWEPARWENTLTAGHIDGGGYLIQPITWRPGDNTSWQLSYGISEIGRYKTIKAAQTAADEHHARTHRANLWTRYMAENDPPEIPGAGGLVNCAVCGGSTQWGVCPKCQPVRFARLP